MAGDWQTADLPALLTLLARNRDGAARHPRQGLAPDRPPPHPPAAGQHPGGSQRNIQAHYDLGNDFYRLWLDPGMTYSSALGLGPARAWRPPSAQVPQHPRHLDARPGQVILEIGCGWGGFAEIAVQEYGCRVLGLTLSKEQLAWARQRAEQGGWAGSADFELCDYRDVRGSYDHIVSIEMMEAVGERFWPGYFAQIRTASSPAAGPWCRPSPSPMPCSPLPQGHRFHPALRLPGGMLPSPESSGVRPPRPGWP
jgi:cyclopropane-fatty-acyl-phospholipid synthase